MLGQIIPVIWADFLRDQLRWDLSQQEGEVEDGLSIVVFVGSQSEICQEVVRVCLRNISTIKLKSKEHQTTPRCNPPINFTNQSVIVSKDSKKQGSSLFLFSYRPLKIREKSMYVFIVLSGPIELAFLRVIEDRWLIGNSIVTFSTGTRRQLRCLFRRGVECLDSRRFILGFV